MLTQEQFEELKSRPDIIEIKHKATFVAALEEGNTVFFPTQDGYALFVMHKGMGFSKPKTRAMFITYGSELPEKSVGKGTDVAAGFFEDCFSKGQDFFYVPGATYE